MRYCSDSTARSQIRDCMALNNAELIKFHDMSNDSKATHTAKGVSCVVNVTIFLYNPYQLKHPSMCIIVAHV